MRSLVEYRFYQGIVDHLDFGWMPETYYTFAPGETDPSSRISEELLDVCEPYLGAVMSDVTQRAIQFKVDEILRDYEIRRHILIWTNSDSVPGLIDCAKVVQWGDCAYAIRPYMDRTAIMAEVLENLEKENG